MLCSTWLLADLARRRSIRTSTDLLVVERTLRVTYPVELNLSVAVLLAGSLSLIR